MRSNQPEATSGRRILTGAPDWGRVRRILVIRLRSIGDTVLCTPSLTALRQFLPSARIDVLLEDWVAPILVGHEDIDEILEVPSSFTGRIAAAVRIRRNRYDVVFNLHGGPTSGIFTRTSGASWRVGYSGYQFPFLYNLKLESSAVFWGRSPTHSAEQQLALLGAAGVPVDHLPGASLPVTASAEVSLSERLKECGLGDPDVKIVLMHPAASSFTKAWAPGGFAAIADYLSSKGFVSVAVGSPDDRALLENLRNKARVPVNVFADLTLPEITSLATRSGIFVGNDSGIAHIASAAGIPSVVIFGSSNRAHWAPWTNSSSRMVYHELPCQPCAGYTCEEFGEPKCILSVEFGAVRDAVDALLHGGR